MFRKLSKKVANDLIKCGHPLYYNDEFLIAKQYLEGNLIHLVKDIGNVLLSALIGLGYIIITPFLIIYYLLSYIPNVYIIDESIDKQKEAEELEVNNSMRELFKNREDGKNEL